VARGRPPPSAEPLAGAGRLAGERVWTGQDEKAFVVGGGVQHAGREREAGFGVFSDVGICAEHLLTRRGTGRVMVLDTDAHAGDGVQEIFEADPRVFHVSIHQDPATIYPGRGFAGEIGSGAGEGFSVNVPLPPGAGGRCYEKALADLVEPLARAFRPAMILMVDGGDPHFSDRITRMGLRLEDLRKVAETVAGLADEVCDGRVVDFIGSGYSRDPRVVSRAWLASVCGLTGAACEVTEPVPMPKRVDPEAGLGPTARTVDRLRRSLSRYWDCFE